MLLDQQQVLVVGDARGSALVRFLASLGASVRPVTLHELPTAIDDASFLVERLGLARLTGPCSREELQARNPRVIHVSVTTFGSYGPRALWQGSELVASAMSGTLNLTGTTDRPPVKEALDACYFHADMVAAAGAMAAHYERGTSGIGQHVDVSVQEVAFSRNINSILVWQFDRRKLYRVGGALNYGIATVRCIWRLADGYCFHTLMTGRIGAPANQALSDWIDAAGLANPLQGVDWSRYNRSTLDIAVRAGWEQAIDAFFRTRSRADIAVEGRRRGINATVICEPADVLADPHLEARRFWIQQRSTRVPGRFVGITQSEPCAPPMARAASRPGPLAGIRVLDFSWALVGSITTKTLGDLGADVIKIESRSRPCLSRIDVQVGASRAGNFDDKPWFAHLNSSKRSLALDMKRSESREILTPLIQWADVVAENFSPGTMAKLGLDYASLCRINPNLVMVSGSVYGQSGPYSQEWGVDGTGAALSGRTYLTGWPDRDPVIPGAVPYGDVIVPYVMSAAVGAALQERRITGHGCHIDASMYEICVQQMYEAILQAQMPANAHPQRMGNDDPRIFHQGVYPVMGVDRWIAISCATVDEWTRVLRCAELPPSTDPGAGRGPLSEWTRTQLGAALADRLQAAGVAAGVVQDIEDLMEHDPTLVARESLTPLPHALLGTFGHVRTPLIFSRSKIEPYRSPSIGEHSQSIAQDISSLTRQRISELEELGVFQ